MNKRILPRFLALASLISFGFNKQVDAQGASTYQFSAVSGTYVDLVGGTPFTAVQSDDVLPTTTVPIGFTFNFCGTDYTTVRVCSNGFVTFVPGASNTAFNDVSSFGTVKPALMWLWDDLDGATGTATYSTSGTSPNQVFTFQFKNWEWYWNATGPNISVQVKLYEGTNIVEYVYNQEIQAGTPNSASIGIVDGQTTPTYLSLNNATANPTASATTFTTTIAAKPASGQIYRFKPVPPIDIKMDSIVTNAQFCANGSTPVSVAITNKGTATITDILVNWSVDGVTQAPVSYTMPVPVTNFVTAPNNIAVVPLGDVFFPNTTPRVIKAWVVQANGLPDAVNTNDTATGSKTPNLTGVYVNINPRDKTICEGTQITLDAGTHPKNPIYIWNNAQLTQTIHVSAAGTYSVKVQNTDGCFDRDTMTVSTYPEPLVNSIAMIDNADGSYTFNVIGAQNITNYEWDFGDGFTQPGTGQPGQIIHQYDTAGDYVVTLTLSNDCGEITVTRTIHTNGMVSPTGVNELGAVKNAFSIYPNPSKSMVSISNTDGIKIKSVTVLNIVGQQVFNKTDVNATKFQFSTTDMATGIYNVVIDSEKGKVVKKLEVMK